MELEQLEDAYTHLEAASTEQLRGALRRLANDPQALSPLLMIAAPESRSLQVRPATAVVAETDERRWVGEARRRRTYVALAGAALVVGTLLGGLLAEEPAAPRCSKRGMAA
jgi:hypothetical protein